MTRKIPAKNYEARDDACYYGTSNNSKHESTFHLACTAVHGKHIDTSPSIIIEEIQEKFKSLNVKRKDERPMYYYKNYRIYETQNTRTAELLGNSYISLQNPISDGQCAAWTKFFLDCLKVHGIREPGNQIRVGWNANADNGVLVKNWNFNQNPKGEGNQLGDPDDTIIYTHVNILPNGKKPKVRKLADEEWIYYEVTPGAVTAGQNNPDTPRSFNNHHLASAFGYKDPSYGTESVSDRDFGLSGYYCWVKVTITESEWGLDFDGQNGVENKPVTVDACIFAKHKPNEAPLREYNY